MSKLDFKSLNLLTNTEVQTITFHDQEIEVKQYIPVQEKNECIGELISELVMHNENYCDYGYLEIISVLAIINLYSNISFEQPEAAEETRDALYDQIYSSGLKDAIFAAIPTQEKEDFMKILNNIIESTYAYHNSFGFFLGRVNGEADVIAELKALLSETDLDALKDIMSNLG